MSVWIYDGMEIDSYPGQEGDDGTEAFRIFLMTAGPGGIANARARYALHSTHDPQYPKAGNTGISTGVPGRAGGSDGGWNPDYIPPAYAPPAAPVTTPPPPVTPPPGGTPVTGTPTGGPPSGGNPPGGAGGWGGGVAGGRPTTGTTTGTTTTGTTTTGTTTATNIPWGLIIAAVVVLFLLRK